MTGLFDPLLTGDIPLSNRIVMSALTRARAGRSHIPNAVMADYYSQRAAAGLIISEATMVAADGCAFTGEGGLFDEACVAGWRTVTDAVHALNGRMLVQLWHPGRAAHSLLNAGTQPISSTDRAIQGDTIHTPEGVKPYEVPRRLDASELPGIIALFARAAERAMRAGFDGVQIHGAHGYLIDQFLRDSVNDRTDDWGGSLVKRARLLLEIVDAASAAIGAGRVGVRISPLVPYNDIADSNAPGLVQHVAQELDRRAISHLEIRHSDHKAAPEMEIAKIARRNFRGALLVNGSYDRHSAQAAIESGAADAVVFGRPFIANPDLVARFASGASENSFDPKTLYGGGAAGYSDYPSLKAPA